MKTQTQNKTYPAVGRERSIDPLRLPAVGFLLRPMIRHHIRRRTAALKAIYDRRAAVADDDRRQVEKAWSARVGEFCGSLPAPRTRCWSWPFGVRPLPGRGRRISPAPTPA